MLTTMGAGGELFHTAAGTAFADLLIDGHRETWPVRSGRFRAWLRQRYYQQTGAAASAAAIRSALDLIEVHAQFEGLERTVHVRIAEHGECIYLDLADAHWRAVEISREGWRLIAAPPARFRRPGGMLPLPVPETGGSIEALGPFLNLRSRADFVLVVAWLLAMLQPRGPYPILAISGEQGSAKTVLSKLLRALVDPNTAPVRALARNERELMIAASNSHLLAFDNVSNVPFWLSDALCRLASGASFAVRKLYSNDDEVLFQAARPILLNSIEDVISRPDLADRAIFLSLSPIVENERRPEAALWEKFEEARPRLLGALLDAAAHGLCRFHSVRLDRLPRMADFAIWATACETAFWPPGTFARAYEANRRAAVDTVIDADPVAACVRDIMAEQSAWTGSATELLHMGADRCGLNSCPGWPKNPRALAGRLRRAQTFLRALGIDIAFGREGRAGNRIIRIHMAYENSVSTVGTASSAFEDRRDSPQSSPVSPQLTSKWPGTGDLVPPRSSRARTSSEH
jgi:hypothetical protein